MNRGSRKRKKDSCDQNGGPSEKQARSHDDGGGFSDGEILDLSRKMFDKASDIVAMCSKNVRVKKLLLRDIRIDGQTEQSCVLRTLKEECPLLQHIDISGCSEEMRKLLLGESCPLELPCPPELPCPLELPNPQELQESRTNIRIAAVEDLSRELGVEIRNYVEENPVLKKILNPNNLRESWFAGQIRDLVEDGVPADLSVNGWTLLHTACLVQDVGLCELLLHKGADGSAKSSEGDTPLHVFIKGFIQDHRFIACDFTATTGRLKDVCKLFLDLGSNGNIQNNEGNTPLHLVSTAIGELLAFCDLHQAPIKAIKEVWELFLDHGANGNTQNSEGNTPLHLVLTVTDEVLTGWGPMETFIKAIKKVCKLFLDHGSNGNIQNNEGNTPLHLALTVIDEVLTCWDPSETPIKAIKEVCKLFLDLGSNGNIQNNEGNTPLHLVSTAIGRLLPFDYLLETSIKAAEEVYKLFLEHGANGNTKNNEGNTPLHLVLTVTVNKLLCWDSSGPSIKAIKEVCKLFLDHGSNGNIQNNEGNTPLHLVLTAIGEVLTRWGPSETPIKTIKEVCKLFLDHGSNGNIQNNKGNTPLHLALTVIDEVLTRWGPSETPINELLFWDLSGPSIKTIKEVCKLFLDHGSNGNIQNNKGNTPLHLALTVIDEVLTRWGPSETPINELLFWDLSGPSIKTIKEVCKLFLDHGSNGNIQNNKGNTPLHLVLTAIGEVLTRWGPSETPIKTIKEVCKLFLDHGSNGNIQNNKGNTPLHLVLTAIDELLTRWGPSETPIKTIKEVCKLFLDHGSNGNIQNNKGNTPLHLVLTAIDELLTRWGPSETPIKTIKEVCKLFLDHGSNGNIQNNEGNITLHLVSTAIGRLLPYDQLLETSIKVAEEVYKLFLEHGANGNTQNNEGNTPLHLVLTVTVNELLFWDLSGPSIKAIKEVCKLFLDHGSNGNIQNNEGNTPLHLVLTAIDEVLTRWGPNETPIKTIKEVCKLFLDLGSNGNIQNNEGNITLHLVSTAIGRLLPIDDLLETSIKAVEEVYKLFLEHGANVNTQNNEGNTPLHLVLTVIDEVVTGWRPRETPHKALKEVCGLFLDHGVNGSIQNNERNTPLHLISMVVGRLVNFYVMSETYIKEIKEVCGLFLDHGKVGNTRNCEGDTPMHVFLKCIGEETGEISIEAVKDVCEIFLNHGTDGNLQNNRGDTPLHLLMNCVSVTHSPEATERACKLLLDHRADINARNTEGESPIFVCIRSYFRSCRNAKIRQELKRSSIEHREGTIEQTQTQFCSNVVKFCKWLYEAGANIAWKNNDSDTVYHHIVRTYVEDTQTDRHDCSAMAKQLTAYFCGNKQVNVRIDSRGNNGNTPLHLLTSLCRNPHPDRPWFRYPDHTTRTSNTSLLECLVAGGNAVDAVNDLQRTPLHLARCWQMAKALILAGAVPNAKDKFGNTPLLMWMQKEIDNIDWQEVVEKGMDHLSANSAGETVVNVLLSKRKHEDVVRLIAELKSINPRKLNEKDTNGETLLHVACRYEDDRIPEIIELLLKSGANPNLANKQGETPMHVLCNKLAQNSPSFQFSLPNTRQFTRHPDSLSQASNDPFNASFSAWAIRVLKKYGADPTIADNEGYTCMDLAKDNNLTHLQELLEKAVDQMELPPLLPWIRQSEKHKVLLSQVARHQNSKLVEGFHYSSEPIGSGSFGDVFVGINEKDGREVAIKRIVLQRLNRPEDKREIKNLLQLRDSEQVVKYLSYHKSEDFLFIFLELMDGSLEDLTCPEPNHVVLCRDVMSGLAFLFENNILHRDIKPGNILYKSKPRLCLKLADFGLSAKTTFSATVGTKTVMHSKAGTRCWMASELLAASRHSEASDVFSAGLVLHYIMAEKKHAFEPKSMTGMSDAMIQNEVEFNIMSGRLNMSDSLSAEASHLLEGMLQHNKDDRLSAAKCLNHPYFWSKAKMVQFLFAVGNQPEFEEPRHVAAVRGPCSVEVDVEAALSGNFAASPWDNMIPRIYAEMTSAPRSRRYKTSSVVELVRFIRNSYAHVSDLHRPTPFQEELLKNFVYFDTYPTLFITVYKAAMTYMWNAREEIRYVMEEIPN